MEDKKVQRIILSEIINRIIIKIMEILITGSMEERYKLLFSLKLFRDASMDS